MKVIDILNKQITVLPNTTGYLHYPGCMAYTQINRSIKWVIDLGYTYKQPIDKLRSMEYHSKEQKDYKIDFPCWFVGGLFPIEKTEDEDIISYSNILSIDIDKKDNKDIDINKIKNELFKLPYVFMISKSISGEGIYVLILVEDGKYTKEYYTYISNLWSKQYNLNIDNQCTNIGRKRYISYDDNLLIKDDNIDITPWKFKHIVKEEKPVQQSLFLSYHPKQFSSNNLAQKAIWKLLNDGYSIDDMNGDKLYNIWYHVACDFHHFEDGLEMFIRFSNNSTKYKDKNTDIIKKYNNAKIETEYDNVAKKWCGICKRKYGLQWWK